MNGLYARKYGTCQKAGGNYYKIVAIPIVYIDLDRLHHVGQVLNTYLLSLGCQKLQTQHTLSDFQNVCLNTKQFTSSFFFCS